MSSKKTPYEEQLHRCEDERFEVRLSGSLFPFVDPGMVQSERFSSVLSLGAAFLLSLRFVTMENIL